MFAHYPCTISCPCFRMELEKYILIVITIIIIVTIHFYLVSCGFQATAVPVIKFFLFFFSFFLIQINDVILYFHPYPAHLKGFGPWWWPFYPHACILPCVTSLSDVLVTMHQASYLTITSLSANSADNTSLIFVLSLLENRIWHYKQIATTETVCTKCQNLFSGKKK